MSPSTEDRLCAATEPCSFEYNGGPTELRVTATPRGPLHTRNYGERFSCSMNPQALTVTSYVPLTRRETGYEDCKEAIITNTYADEALFLFRPKEKKPEKERLKWLIKKGTITIDDRDKRQIFESQASNIASIGRQYQSKRTDSTASFTGRIDGSSFQLYPAYDQISLADTGSAGITGATWSRKKNTLSYFICNEPPHPGIFTSLDSQVIFDNQYYSTG